MYRKLRLPLLVLIAAFLLILLPVAVAFISKMELDIQWKDVLVEYYRILTSIIPVLFGFFLINFYWEQKIEVEKIEAIKHHLHYDFRIIRKSIGDIQKLIEEHSLSPGDMNVLCKLVIYHRHRIQHAYRDIQRQVDRIISSPDITLADTTSHYLQELDKSFLSFFAINLRKQSPKSEEFVRIVHDIANVTQDTIRQLTEDSRGR